MISGWPVVGQLLAFVWIRGGPSFCLLFHRQQIKENNENGLVTVSQVCWVLGASTIATTTIKRLTFCLQCCVVFYRFLVVGVGGVGCFFLFCWLRQY